LAALRQEQATGVAGRIADLDQRPREAVQPLRVVAVTRLSDFTERRLKRAGPRQMS